MPPVTLEGDTLGQKRRHYNQLVEDAIVNKHYDLCNISDNDSDIDNLLKIDIASKNRNVDYIIEVLKSNDMLYAATAIKRSTWLITDPQYANIINPEYIHTQLLPSMNTRTFNKLMLHIRLNLKDETRVETFYEYLKHTGSAYKWLQNCSIPFIENVIKNERLIPLSLFKRLCKRSAHFLAYHKRVEEHPSKDLRTEMLFMLRSHPEDLLNILEDKNRSFSFNQIGKKKTRFLMKTCPQRVLDSFEIYINIIDLCVASKYLKKEEIKPFLHKLIKQFGWSFCEYDKLKHFVKNMPEVEKLELIKKTFINRIDLSFLRSEDEKTTYECGKPYQWYEFLPFNVAFPELKKLVLAENTPSERCAMLSVLVTCARNNSQNIKALLCYFYERHINEPFKFKIEFVNNLLSQIPTHEFNVETWNILDQLFHSMEVYTDSANKVEQCLESIIVYKVLHDEPVPEIVEQKFSFNTFQKIQSKLNQEQNDKLFTYLLNLVLTKVQIEKIANESDFSEAVQQLNNVLSLLRDWKKEISHYPVVLNQIQALIQLKREKVWNVNLSDLYNVKKSWRKHMFEESLSLYLNEESCLNALKHKPQLLTLHDDQIETLRTNDAVSLRRLLSKLRVYWPNSLAQHWTDAYLQNLNKPTGQKAVIRSLFMLLPHNEIIDFAKKHIPIEFKINWGEVDHTEVSIRKNIAKHLYLARPLIPLETVLWYAKGDYLQHAVPSLNAILSNLSQVESRNHILKLLDAPVSLRKLGLQFAFLKLKPDELITVIVKTWNTTTNSIIRSVIFKATFGQICNSKNTTTEKECWEILSAFIDQLSASDNKGIYKTLTKVGNVPISVRGKFLMKSYELLSSLPASANCEVHANKLANHVRLTPKTLELLDDDFVNNKFLAPAGTKFCARSTEFVEIFVNYVLWADTEEAQVQRFKKVLDPALEEVFISWNNTHSDSYYVKENFDKFIETINCNYKDFVLKRKIAPAKLFTEIKLKMENKWDLLENYVLYTSWKLVTEYAILMNQQISKMGDAWLSDDDEKSWENLHAAMYPDLATVIVKCLKEDTKNHYPSICLLFTDALNAFSSMFPSSSNIYLEILKHMLNDPDFAPSYVVVSRVFYRVDNNSDSKTIRKDIRKKIMLHPSEEVQLHYYNEFSRIPFDE